MSSEARDSSHGGGSSNVSGNNSTTNSAAKSNGTGSGKMHAFSANAPPFNPASGLLAGTRVVRDIRDMSEYDVHAMAMSAAGMMPCMLPQTYMPMPVPMGLPAYSPTIMSRYSGMPVVRPPQPIASSGAGPGMSSAGSAGSAAARKMNARSTSTGSGGASASMTGASSAAATAANAASSSSSPRREGSTDKERFSVYAKPWSPQPDTNDDAMPGKRIVDIDLPLWMPATCCGKVGVAPVPLVSHEVNSNLFVHFVTIVPRMRTDIELKLYYYTCARCPLKTLYGRLSTRKPDVTLRNVAPDVPPICIAHLIDEVAGARVTALHIADADSFICDVWLDKPNMSIQVVSALSGAMWTCPMFHGYAVYTETDEARLFLLDYLNKFKVTAKFAQSVYPMTPVEAKEHM